MRHYAVYARLGAGFMLLVFWGLVGSPLFGVAFIIALLALSVVRYRFGAYRWVGLLEISICAIYACWWLPALLGIWLPIIGFLEDKWNAWEQALLRQDFEDRAERLRLESTRDEAAREIRHAARLAEMAERARIAQDIHDHVGHEISGASIALQTAVKLYEKGDTRTGELLYQTAARLESAAAHLRETVHNLKPACTPGVSILEELCGGFRFCPVEFRYFGDLAGFTRWELLAANLKETLTNVARHSNATQVSVRLDGNAYYIRLMVKDNGQATHQPQMGMGLSGMRERVRMAGGTLSVSVEDGFQVVCVLPREREAGEHEIIDR